MMKRLTLAALGLVAACAAQPRNDVYAELLPATAPGFADIAACDIRETPTPQGVRIEAVAQAGEAVHGDYEFVISARGAGGASDVTQAGPLDLAAGEAATVGSAELPQGHYRATLTLRDAAGELCHLERSA
ncbi:MAG: hypothetical protein FP825_12570 [Hyphomonas sp.]|uniref:curli-like amyloid fiber formation chaperone CsgH n=1 Tax=Hyphomonas sp. TaxID=87 RepID=UPI0017FF6506|nr:curli-like amyloid fiber formation chaperone CsgH [Hyphomonas sp.]MBU3921943.1 hypothetical protein [Alphaproteobacteria bacterium]MBA3069296.1 hypothetical protein [Hyphomonas sp.]MBU4063677.1 hypothetical protein [Alphaproteobacteria bacterium]MBU4164362.1 hypothetical protein [Alphaproteobacteria bacterium]MBU4569197.1 hypothetical protein [Alphaproteobacteria bacterium]